MSEELAEWQKRIIDLTDSDEMEMIEEGNIELAWWERWKNRQTEEIFEIEYKIRRTPIRVKKYDRNR